jgi:hypothetical protein
MPVRRFRSVEQMAPPWHTPGDPALYRAIAAAWSLGMRTTAPRFPPGLYRHPTLASLNETSEGWAAENFRRFQARQRAGQTSTTAVAAREREWMAQWRGAGPALEQVRADELARMTSADALAAADALLGLGATSPLPESRVTWSGLVELQRSLHRK